MPGRLSPAGGIGGGRVDTDPARRGAPGVEHNHHPPVALGSPGAHHHVGAPRGGAPVDGAHVVADDILTQRIEFGALPAHQGGQQPVDLAQPGQPRRQVLAGQERRQHPQLAGHRLRPLPSGQAQRPDGAGGDHRGPLVAAAHRFQPGRDVLVLTGGDVHRVQARPGPRAGRPGVADLAAEPARAVVVDQQRRVGVLAEPGRAVGGADVAQPRWAGRQRGVDGHRDRQGRQQCRENRCGPRRQGDGQDADQRDQPGASGQDHRGTGTDARIPSSTPSQVAPSSSASGRSITRCRSVGRAMALTSSGVT